MAWTWQSLHPTTQVTLSAAGHALSQGGEQAGSPGPAGGKYLGMEGEEEGRVCGKPKAAWERAGPGAGTGSDTGGTLGREQVYFTEFGVTAGQRGERARLPSSRGRT